MDKLERSQLRFQLASKSKQALTRVLILVVLVLLILPLWTTFQDVLTRLVMNIGWYRSLQEFIVPYELKIVGSVLNVMGLAIKVGKTHIEWTKANGAREAIFLVWNCIGWQS